MRVQLFLREESDSVNALELGIAFLPLPVGAATFINLNAWMRLVEGMCGPRQKSINFPVV